MIYSSPKMRYLVVASVSENEVNDCYIAREQGKDDGSLYTLVVIKDHERVKELLEIFRVFTASGDSAEVPLVIDFFANDTGHVLVLPYRTGRPIADFFDGDAFSLRQCEEICTNIILTCISSGLPWPVLYLALSQGKVNLSKENTVYLSYDLDMRGLDSKITESDCATVCAEILLVILSSKRDQKNISYELLSRRAGNRSYTRFTELYRDIQIASTPAEKRKITTKIRSFFYRNADTLFGILFWISLILAVIAIAFLLSNLVVGDIPILRILYNSFKQIGTEKLNK